jgi:hypothetical protein
MDLALQQLSHGLPAVSARESAAGFHASPRRFSVAARTVAV